MISVGEKLGGRYFVISEADPAKVDVLHEVRDPQGVVSYAQFLLGVPLPLGTFEALRGELAAIPSSRPYRRPDEVVRSSAGVPAAIFRQAHPPTLTDRLTALFSGEVEERRRAGLRVLVAWFAPLSEELNNLHAVGIIHGAITIDRLHVIEDSGSERLGLSGFGIEAAARFAAAKPRPSPRADFAALALALQAAMERTGARPDGAAVVRWEMIRSCARAGDHPALQSGLAFANAIRQLVDEPARRISRSNLTAVGRAGTTLPDGDGASPQAPRPGGYGPGASPRAVGDPSSLSSTAFTPPPEAHPHVDTRRRRFIIAAGAAVALLMIAAILTLTGQQAPGDYGPMSHVRAPVPTRCGDEPLAPPSTVAMTATPSQVGSICLGDVQEIAVLARVDDTLVMARRRNGRGARFEERPTVVAEGVQHVGTSVSGPSGWTAWISRTGPVFGLARIDHQVHRIVTATPGLRADSFRGAMLLRADATGAWIGTTYLEGGRERAAVVEFPARRSDEPRVATVYLITEGAAVAAIPGDPATLLLRESAGGRVTFTAVSLPLNTLAGLSTATGSDGGTAESDGGATATRELSTAVIVRSAPWTSPVGLVQFAPLGAGVTGSSRRFLATVVAADGGCDGPGCAGNGSVIVLEVPPRGDTVAREIEARGRGQMIGLGVNNTIVAAVTRASDGELVPHVLDAGSEGAAKHWVLGGLDEIAVLTCGDEPWLAFAQGSPQLRLGAIPLACALR